ncbi:MAG: molybdopterin molybdenumtransferase MoeA [Gammaproteobacteria bacterium]|nr:MAG: molybdopterin molybdenumtransferase MoeA [Gammaproteobacteria bacterium]
MTQDCCATPKTSLIPVETARTRILERVRPVSGTEYVPLAGALDRVLAVDVASPIDVPAFDNSAMDGYAVRHADLAAGTPLRVVGRALAGAPFDGHVGPGEAVRIMTGAPLPAGADTVVMQEQTRLEGETLFVEGEHRPAEHVRRAGEDLRRGTTVLPAGHRLGVADIGLLASVGVSEVPVRRRARVAFFSTGDELVPPGRPLAPGEIYDSNRQVLRAALQRLGVELHDLGILPDDRAATEQRLGEAAALADAVVTSGGVSVGEADYVKETVERLGELDLWRIRIKPGKPLAVGRIGSTLFFGLPGNPVSTLVTFMQFVRPALEKLSGTEPRPPLALEVPLAEPIDRHPGRQEYLRGRLERDAQGALRVRPNGAQGSHVMTSFRGADCFIVLPPEAAHVEAGARVRVEPFCGLP